MRTAQLESIVTAEASAAAGPITANSARTQRNRPAVTKRRTALIIDLSCVMCGRDLGVLDADAWPAYGAVVLRRTGVTPVVVTDWRRLRCAVCGGAAIPVDITSRVLRTERPIDWAADKPRRGRPPKAVVEARKVAESQ